jgi:hypothetical protein
MSSEARHPDERDASASTGGQKPDLGEDTSDQLRMELALQSERLMRAAHQEELIDEALEETFPASDPISPIRVT